MRDLEKLALIGLLPPDRFAMISLQFLGAAREVTGSMHLLTVGGHRLLLDCGLIQGPRKTSFERNRAFPVVARDIDAVVLSHAHIAHSGRLPLLVKGGYRGHIFCTSATRDLCAYMLPDAGHLQELDVSYRNKRRAAQGRPVMDPLYTLEDAIAVMPQLRTVELGQKDVYKRQLLPIIATELLGLGPLGYGLLSTAQAVGAVVAGVVLGLRPPIRRQGAALFGGVVVYGLASALFGLSTVPLLSYLLFALTGAGDMVSTVVRGTIRQTVTPDALRGRMTSINMLFFMGGPQLGEVEAGAIASVWGASVAMVTGGLATLVYVGSVSYTHLDVYKRQACTCTRRRSRIPKWRRRGPRASTC